MPGYGFDATGIELDPNSQWYLVKGGVAFNFKQLGFNITAFNNASMPPLDNVLTPLGTSGGAIVQRTVPTPRYLNLMGTIEGDTYAEMRRKKAQLALLLRPNSYNQTPADLAIRFRDSIGGGPDLEMPCIYAGGLEGSITSLYGETVTLQFIELQPPSIKELTTTSVSLNINATDTQYLGVSYRDAATGVWTSLTTLPTHEVTYSPADFNPPNDLIYGTVYTAGQAGAKVLSRAGVNVLVTHSTPANAKINKIVCGPRNAIYVGGNFTSPNAYIGKVNGTSLVATVTGVADSFNGEVMDMVIDNRSRLWVVGKFTTPGNRVAYIDLINGSGWQTIGTGFNNDCNAVAKGPDGTIYFGGKFSTANGVTVNGICSLPQINGTVFSPLGSGIVTSIWTITKLDTLPNGSVVVGGNFGYHPSGQGIGNATSAKAIALWNGQQYLQIDRGLSGDIVDLLVDDRNSEIYVTQLGNGVADGPTMYNLGTASRVLSGGFNKYNGVSWVSQDMDYSQSNSDAIALNLNNGELAVSGSTAVSGGRQLWGYNDILYTGTAEVYPQIVMKPLNGMAVYGMINYTTGKEVFFDFTTLNPNFPTTAVQPGETITMQFGGPDGAYVQSTIRGNMLGYIIDGSDVGSFTLVPGHNYIACYVNYGAVADIKLNYKNTYLSFDGGM